VNFFKYLKLKEWKLKDIKEVDRQVIARYQSFFESNSSKSGKVARRQCFFAVKNFLKWLERDDSILDNPLENVPTPAKVKKVRLDFFTEEEMKRILKMTDSLDKIGRRDAAILELLYDTGIKNGELTNLKVSDVDLESSSLTIRKPNEKKDREVPFCGSAMSLGNYRNWRRSFPNAATLPWFFISSRGTKMETKAVSRIVQKYARKAGIHRKVTPLMIRNSAALNMVRCFRKPEQIQEIFGHKNLQTTEEMLKALKLAELQNAHMAYHPRGKRQIRTKSIKRPKNYSL